MVAKSIWPCLIGFSLLLSACQTTQLSDTPETLLDPNDSTSAVLLGAREAGNEPDLKPALGPTDIGPENVVSSLQFQSLQYQAEGKWTEAGLVLERAMRIDASKVDLYHQLATVRMGQKRFNEAEQIALRGLVFSGGNAQYKASIWQVIAQCRSARSDIVGANEAREKVLYWTDQE